MDKLAKVRAEIERILKCFPTSSMCQSANDFSMCYLNDFLKLIDTLQEEPVSEELEAEMQRYYVDWDEHPQYTQTARHFARWQKEQMLKAAVGGYVIEDIEEGNGDFLLSADYLPKERGFKDQQKVKVIVLKDE